jgi:hypothetical protein
MLTENEDALQAIHRGGVGTGAHEEVNEKRGAIGGEGNEDMKKDDG